MKHCQKIFFGALPSSGHRFYRFPFDALEYKTDIVLCLFSEKFPQLVFCLFCRLNSIEALGEVRNIEKVREKSYKKVVSEK